MKITPFLLIIFIGIMMMGIPLRSYADPQLDTLLTIATQARDSLGITISQTSNVSDEIKQLYQQGSDETEKLSTAVDQGDAESAKQHFLAAMNFFKETNDKISSLGTTPKTSEQSAQVTDLRSEIARLGKVKTLLQNIATGNNIDINFTKFNEFISTANQNLNSSNLESAKKAIDDANNFLVETHNTITNAAKEKASERAKDFTEKQIERFSSMSDLNTNQTIESTVATTVPLNQSANLSEIYPEPAPVPESNQTNNTAIVNPQQTTLSTVNQTNNTVSVQPQTPQNFMQPSLSTESQKDPRELLAELKKLVSEGKVDDALKVIKILDSYQKQSNTTENKDNLVPSTNVPELNQTNMTISSKELPQEIPEINSTNSTYNNGVQINSEITKSDHSTNSNHSENKSMPAKEDHKFSTPNKGNGNDTNEKNNQKLKQNDKADNQKNKAKNGSD